VPPGDPALDWDMNLGAQIDRFLADSAGQDRSVLTAVVMIGGNDYGHLDGATAAELIASALNLLSDVAGATIEAAQDLCDAGVGAVVVCTVPSAEFFPVFADAAPAELAAASVLLDLHNAAIKNAVNELADQGYEVRVIDMAAMAEAIADDPTAFGLLAGYGDTLIDDPSVLDDFDADQVAFWDGLHPTTATHGVMGSFFAHALENEVRALNDGDNAAFAGALDELVLGYGGDDLIIGGAGDDVLIGGTGDDFLIGGADDDVIMGGSDANVVYGGAGTDILSSTGTGDFIHGGADDDVIVLSGDQAFANGGAGADTFIWIDPSLLAGGSTTNVIEGGLGEDTLYLVLSSDQIAQLETGVLNDPSQLGLTLSGIENIEIIEERAGLSALSDMDWFETADLWGIL
ncbi:MAG: hypothetical protein JKX69_14770, partial [Rhodobacteraceae bacterium]|nr:hypothetical protein [Paracoccaceae bacterium]